MRATSSNMNVEKRRIDKEMVSVEEVKLDLIKRGVKADAKVTDEYAQHLMDLIDEHEPIGPVELKLVEDAAMAKWHSSLMDGPMELCSNVIKERSRQTIIKASEGSCGSVKITSIDFSDDWDYGISSAHIKWCRAVIAETNKPNFHENIRYYQCIFTMFEKRAPLIYAHLICCAEKQSSTVEDYIYDSTRDDIKNGLIPWVLKLVLKCHSDIESFNRMKLATKLSHRLIDNCTSNALLKRQRYFHYEYIRAIDGLKEQQDIRMCSELKFIN